MIKGIKIEDDAVNIHNEVSGQKMFVKIDQFKLRQGWQDEDGTLNSDLAIDNLAFPIDENGDYDTEGHPITTDFLLSEYQGGFDGINRTIEELYQYAHELLIIGIAGSYPHTGYTIVSE